MSWWFCGDTIEVSGAHFIHLGLVTWRVNKNLMKISFVPFF